MFALSCGSDGDKPVPPPARGTTLLCKTDAQCDKGRCDPLRGCVECLFDHDCSDGESCRDRECQAIVPCDGAADCTDSLAPVCSDASKTCVACVVDGDCPGTAHCTDNECKAYEPCQSKKDCNSGVCDASRGECVECVAAADCGRGGLCVAAKCETACHAEKDCSGKTPVCGPEGYCVECATHAHCPDVYFCAAGSCQLDVCEAGDARCATSGRAVESCNASGSGFTAKPCDARQSCSAVDSAPTCEDWTCDPESEACSSDAHSVELCAADGLSVAGHTACASDEVCIEAACTPKVCKPKKYTCDGGDLYRCSADGTANEVVERCKSNALCDAADGQCVPLVCEPGMPACDGDSVRGCNDDGTAFVGRAEACGDGEACFDGACLERVCLADFECNGNTSYACLDNGTRLDAAERCDPQGSPSTFCNADTGRCETVGCDASQPLCSGDFATVCADDGSGPVDGGVDCTLTDQACFNGSCAPVVCKDQYVCQGSDLYGCEDHGTALNLLGECGRPELCSDVAGVCLIEVCTPGDPVCNDTIATLCDDTGAGYEPDGTDCADTGEGCYQGSCAPLICTPSAYYCADGDVHHCDGSGTQSVVADACLDGEHCVAGESLCEPNSCSPNAQVCNGTVATTCDADGSGPLAGGTNCATTGQACSLGQCVPLVCTPSERFCQGGHVRLCNDSGTASGPYDDCLASEYCDDSDVARCRADRCAPNGAACSGEALAVCNDDGSGYASTGADCAQSAKVCTLAGCSTTATDLLGGTDLSAIDPMATLYLTALEVLTPRTIIGLDAYLGVSTDTDLVWVIYDSATSTGNYEKLFELTTTATAGAATYWSSGTMSVAVTAGHFYAVGVLVRGAHTEYHSSTPSPPLSFAAIAGVMQTDTTSVPAEVWMDGAQGGWAPVRVVTN